MIFFGIHRGCRFCFIEWPDEFVVDGNALFLALAAAPHIGFSILNLFHLCNVRFQRCPLRIVVRDKHGKNMVGQLATQSDNGNRTGFRNALAPGL